MLCRCIVILTLTLPARGQNLVVHYKFDETSGTVVSDSSGNGLDAQTMGVTSWVPGMVAGGLDLDGLRRGRWRRLEPHEVNTLRRSVKLKPVVF